MAFYPRSRTGFRPRRRMAMGRGRFSRYRDPQRTKGLEVANFFIDETVILEDAGDSEEIIYTHIASFPLSLEAAGAGSAGPEQRLGNVLSSAWKYIQISGLVFDWGWEQPDLDGDNLGIQGEYWTTFQVLTDRMSIDTGSGNPIPSSLGFYSPYRSQWPMAVLSTSNPGVDTDQARLPTRVHFTKTEQRYANASRIQNDLEGILYYPQGQMVTFRQPTFNRRLRIRLDEGHGLFFGWFTRTGPAFLNGSLQARSIRRWARGQIYYRVR